MPGRDRPHRGSGPDAPFGPLWRRRLPTVPLALAAAVAQVAGSLGRAHWQGDTVGPGGVALLLAGPLAILLLSGWPLVPLAVAIVAALAYAALGYPIGPIFAAPAAALVLEALRRRSERVAGRRREAHERRERTATTERVVIARDLHDVLGHSLSLINVQAGVALHLLEEHPENARPALETIKAESHQALEEVRWVLEALRDPASTAARAPQPTLRDLPQLVASDAGLPWALTVTGERPEVPASVDAAAYRLVQEAMTNVRRHAQASTADITVRYAAEAVTIEVTDDGVGPGTGFPSPDSEARPDSGGGLLGMGERVAALGGVLTTGAGIDGGFRVSAVLPLVRPGAPS